jgi:tetratricopeptide (TPR) repeat protein
MKTPERDPTLADKLEQALIARDIRAGFALLNTMFANSVKLSPGGPDAHRLLLLLAQWTDLGYRNLEFLQEQLVQFSKARHAELATRDFFRLKLVESFLALATQSPLQAIELLDALLHTGRGILSTEQLFTIYFWRGRAHRQNGSFDAALADIQEAKECGRRISAKKLIAVAKIHESWLVFHKGQRRLAFDLLDEAEKVLLPTGHTLSLGNIAAARGRFVRSAGDYARSLSYFERAIALYRQHNPEHLNVARALVNAAYVKRLMSLELRPRRGAAAAGATNQQALRIAREAMNLLRDAARIYRFHHHQSGSGSVLINLGHLQLESGDMDAAAEEGHQAYELAHAQSDHVLMARARILQAYVEMARSEEQIDEHSDGLPSSQRAIDFADQAVSIALGTQNKRLLAGAYITRGLASNEAHRGDLETSRTYATKAAELLDSEDRDHLYRELIHLRLKITEPKAVDETLRRWANGELGNRSFRQIEEEFAELVIPKVWMNLGRNVSLVAEKLSISPKKVRRILRNSRVSRDHNGQ